MSEIATIDIKLIDDYIEEMQMQGCASMVLKGLLAAIAKILIDGGVSEIKTYKLLDQVVLDICELKNGVENDK